MQIQTVGQFIASNSLLAFDISTKKSPTLFGDLTMEFEKSMLMSSLAFSCSGPYDPPVYPDYADPDSFA